jgi:hypothetical protein
LRDIELLEQIRIDPEVHTILWPNGVDFDAATVHEWPDRLPAMKAHVRQ